MQQTGKRAGLPTAVLLVCLFVFSSPKPAYSTNQDSSLQAAIYWDDLTDLLSRVIFATGKMEMQFDSGSKAIHTSYQALLDTMDRVKKDLERMKGFGGNTALLAAMRNYFFNYEAVTGDEYKKMVTLLSDDPQNPQKDADRKYLALTASVNEKLHKSEEDVNRQLDIFAHQYGFKPEHFHFQFDE